MFDSSARDKLCLRQLIAVVGENSGSDDEMRDSRWTAFIDGKFDDMTDLVLSRLPALRQLLGMARDVRWSLPRLDKRRIKQTFHYLLWRINGELPPIETGLLQAGAIDLLRSDCRAELLLYEEFCELRQSECGSPLEVETRADWLRYKREAVQQNDTRRFLGMRRSKLFHR